MNPIRIPKEVLRECARRDMQGTVQMSKVYNTEQAWVVLMFWNFIWQKACSDLEHNTESFY